MASLIGGKTSARGRPLRFDWTLGFAREPARLACAYWQSRLQGRTMPSRADLDPRAMRAFSSHVGLIEIRKDGQPDAEYFIRLAGGAWEDVYGRMSGRYIHEFLPPEVAPRWREVFDAVRARKAPARVTAGVSLENKAWLDCEMFVAPLGEGGEPTMLFMTFVAWSADEA